MNVLLIMQSCHASSCHVSPFAGDRRTDQTNGISGEAGREVQEIVYGSVVKRHYLSGTTSIMSHVFVCNVALLCTRELCGCEQVSKRFIYLDTMEDLLIRDTVYRGFNCRGIMQGLSVRVLSIRGVTVPSFVWTWEVFLRDL